MEHLLEPLRAWMLDPAVTELAINRPREVFLEREGHWKVHRCEAMTLEHLEQLATAVARYVGGDISDCRPILSAVLPKGERIQLVKPPACEAETVSVTVRRPSLAVSRLERYAEQGFFAHVARTAADVTAGDRELCDLKAKGEHVEFLRRAVHLQKVIVVAGETGSGKTTLMRSLMEEIDPRERLITIEDVPELALPNHPNHVHLFYPSEAREEETAPVTAASLLRAALRMKPTRILLGELRGGEAFDFLQVAASGHGGSITSCHAGSPALAFERLLLMVLQNRQGRQLSAEIIRQLLYLVVDVVIHVHNDVGGRGRHLTEIWFDPESKRGAASRPRELGSAHAKL